MVVISCPPAWWRMFFEIRGEQIEVHFSQEMADLAKKLAVNPQLVDRLDVETMTLRRKE